MIFDNKGWIYALLGERKKAIDYIQQGVAIQEKVGHKAFTILGHIGIGLIYWFDGNLTDAISHCQKSLTISEEISYNEGRAFSLASLGIIYTSKGELHKALEAFQKSLIIHEEMGVKGGSTLGFIYNYLGELYLVRGDTNLAAKYLIKGLSLFEEIENNFLTAMSLQKLTKFHIETKDYENATMCVNKLKKISEKEKTKTIDQIYLMAHASLLKSSDRTIQKAEAQKIFQTITQEEFTSLELTIEALLNLSELLLDELKTSGSEEVFKEIKSCISQLFNLAKLHHSYYLLTETYLLKSKLALMEMKMEESMNFLTQAELIAEEQSLGNLTIKISHERESLNSLIQKLEKLIDQRPNMQEIIEVTQIEGLFDQMLKKRIYRDTKEVLEYAVQARELVKSV